MIVSSNLTVLLFFFGKPKFLGGLVVSKVSNLCLARLIHMCSGRLEYELQVVVFLATFRVLIRLVLVFMSHRFMQY